MPILLTAVCWILLFLFLPADALAVTIASQTQFFSDQLITNKALQELGNNLSGQLSTFTFRVSTQKTNSNQFDFTVQNSRIFDKDKDNFSIIPCTPANYNPDNHLDGITFNTVGVPTGFEDVTLDFSCRNYQFILGHRYLIYFGSANFNQSSGLMFLAGAAYGPGGTAGSIDLFTGGGARLSNGNKYDIYNNSGVCSGITYIWNGTSPYHNGCYVWSSPNDDLYFVLTNNAPPPPPPRLPVVFIPGIGGSELKAADMIPWVDQNDNHEGKFSHAYAKDEKIWVNQDEAVKLGDDDYFDVLRLKSDGVTSEADLSLTGNLTSFGYGDIDSFFTGMGYVKGNNFFVFNYDWRKDVRTTKDSLDKLIEQAKTSSGQGKVNLVVHSMGGLIARYYISDSTKANKVNKLIELGVPHLGTPFAEKVLMYGAQLGPSYLFGLISLNTQEVKDVIQNMTSNSQLLPSSQYFNFYNNSDKNHPYPFKDDRDIDNNNTIGSLNYDQTKSLLSNLGYNMTVFGLSEQLHSSIDKSYNQTNGVKVYEIAGSNQPTLGQIHETWWITWPINLIPKTDEIFINGDDTVPLYSATLKNDSLDLSGALKIYYVDQKHTDLVSQNGTAMQTVKSILNDDNTLPVAVKSEKFDLEGRQISLDDGELELYDGDKHTGINDAGEIEENIPDISYTTSGKTKHAFVKKKAKKVVIKTTRKKPATSTKTTNIKIRTYKKDAVSNTTVFKDIPIPIAGKIEFILDPSLDASPSLILYNDETKTDSITISSTTEVSGDSALDQTSPTTSIQISGIKNSSGIYTDPVTITLSGTDTDSGILRIEYSLDNGQSVQTYTQPFIISAPGKTTLQVKSIDKAGNEEIPQIITIEITPTPTPTPAPSATSSSSETSSSDNNTSPSNSNSSSSNTSSTSSDANTSKVGSDSFEVNKLGTGQSDSAVLGIEFKNPNHVSDEINVSNVLEKLKNPQINKISTDPAKQILGGLLIVSGGIIAIASFGLFSTFIKPIPK